MGEIKIFRDNSVYNDHGTVQNITINGSVEVGALQSIIGNVQNKPNATVDPVLQLLDELVKDAISKGKSAKHILMPVRAAKEAEALPLVDLAWVNGRYNLSLNPTNWSDWVNKKDANYDDRELNGLILRFQKLKTPEN